MNLIKVCCVGLGKRSKIDEIKLASAQSGEADSFDFVGFDGGPLNETIKRHRPHVYLVWDTNANPKWRHELLAMPLSIRRQCLEVQESEPGPQIADKIMACYLDFLNDDRFATEPLVSVFTPAYNSGKTIYRPFNSLLEQTYPNWEWVIVDDSQGPQHTPQTCETQVALKMMADHDPRVQIHRANEHCGVIGEMKRRAAMLSHGSILIELDHDDELTPTAIADCIAAFQAFPDAGFAYSDCAEVRIADWTWRNYGDNWAFGYGPKIRIEDYKGRPTGVMPCPPINSKTVRSIMSMPNHFRAWKRDAYLAAGGHSPHVHVCDDYELMVRTFLSTRFVHIAKLGYIQYVDGETNTQYKRFGEIHRLVRYFRAHYDRQIHQRFLDLGFKDFCWNGEFGDLGRPNEEGCGITANYIFGASREEALKHLYGPSQADEPAVVPATPKDSPPKIVAGHESFKNWPDDETEMRKVYGGHEGPPPKTVVDEPFVYGGTNGPNGAFAINHKANRKFIIVDNFYADPMAVREFALKQEYRDAQSTPNKGLRTKKFLFHGLRDRIEEILGEIIPAHSWDAGDSANGCFQVTFAKSEHVYHCDSQAYAGAIYLSPDAPLEAGTHLIRSKNTKRPNPEKEDDILDMLAWEIVATARNVFNRLVLWDGRHAHCAGEYFGDSLETGRLAQLLFFEIE